MLVLESTSVERTVERIAWKSPGLSAAAALSYGIGQVADSRLGSMLLANGRWS